ncbi:MAG: histidinol phosphate phosphatase, partial [Commensalibacter sp.]|nr:histidinol phosphate phosphatase [Commensalibacter sp.]
MNISDLNSLLKVAESAANAAGEVIRPYFRSSIAADIKSDDSPVTQADRESEKTIRTILQQATPDFGIIGEEYGKDQNNSDYQWVIDPIDGTRAFITGRPIFGVLIALLYKGQPVLGI